MTLDETQINYATTEKKLLATVFAVDKFCSYLVGSKIIIYIDHAAIKYLLSKKDAKAETYLVDTCRQINILFTSNKNSLLFNTE